MSESGRQRRRRRRGACLDPVDRRPAYRVVMARTVAVVLAATLLALAACVPTELATTPAPPGSPDASRTGVVPSTSVGPSASVEPASSPVATGTALAASVPPDRPLASTGSIAVLGADG